MMIRRLLTALVAVCVSFAGFMQSANAALIGTEQVAATQGHARPKARRARMCSPRSPAPMSCRACRSAASIRSRCGRASMRCPMPRWRSCRSRSTVAPAGASDILGIILTIFVVLLITDILGFTKVFPFTRSIR